MYFKKTHLRALDLLIAFYALTMKGFVQIFTTYYAVFMSFVCKTSTGFSCSKMIGSQFIVVDLLNLNLRISFS
jgi:hypothetical protein